MPPAVSASARPDLAQRIAELGQWFHNIDLHGVPTAPDHFLGDYPRVKWEHIAPAIPEDLTGATVLDIGCNGGFYSMEMKRRGASRVLALDVDDRYLDQGRFAAATLGYDIEFQKLSVYDVDQVPGKFDWVLFMGVFYHLRYPLYALDKVVKKVGGRLLFQSLLRGSLTTRHWAENYGFWETEVFSDPEFPCMYFIENKYADDPTNWWFPNAAAAEGALRSAGLEIIAHPEEETWLCAPDQGTREGRFVIDAELAGTL
jgi:tRNA (mo5U34)-methyltransferase